MSSVRRPRQRALPGCLLCALAASLLFCLSHHLNFSGPELFVHPAPQVDLHRSRPAGGLQGTSRVPLRAAPASVLERPPQEQEKSVEPGQWRPLLRSLLLSRSAEKRQKVFEELLPLYEQASDQIVSEIAAYSEASASKPLWARFYARPFFGYRSACASLHRTMVKYVLPEQAGSTVRLQRRVEDGKERVRYVLRDDVADGDQQAGQAAQEPASEEMSQARALAVLLRQLTANSAWELEASAAEAEGGEAGGSFDRWLDRTPKLETPEYEVVYKDPKGIFEVRKYAPYSVVQTGGGTSSNSTGNKAFFKLAGYIFGKTNVEEEKMAMTTPVQIERRTGEMSFIMPSKYWGADALQAAPLPAEGAEVRLEPRPAELVAVSVFGGYARGKAVDEKTKALRAALDGNPSLEVSDDTSVRLLQYNDPFTVPWKRRNEVSIPVTMK